LRVGAVVALQISPKEMLSRKSPGSLMLILIVTFSPGSADGGVEGSTDVDTSANVTEARTLEPEPTATPVLCPLRNIAGKTSPAVKAITLTR
jgi:hypothetical protein